MSRELFLGRLRTGLAGLPPETISDYVPIMPPTSTRASPLAAARPTSLPVLAIPPAWRGS